MAGANLNRAKLNGAHLNKADIQDANLYRAELRFADLPATTVQRLVERMELTPAELEERYETSARRERAAPKPGDKAPVFTLELIDESGARTGEMRSLADHIGKPVALIFGSYT